MPQTTSAVPQAPATSMGLGAEDSLPSKTKDPMKYWNKIFPDAMTKLGTMPGVKPSKSRKPEYDIRDAKTWNEVYGKLEVSHQLYTTATGTRGKMREGRRRIADNATDVASTSISLVPQMDIVAPVLSTVNLIIGAVKRATEVRNQTLSSFDELESIFPDVETFLDTFPDEEGIKKKAVDLVTDVLLAVERMIGFFTESGCGSFHIILISSYTFLLGFVRDC